jgi:thiosulfate/3-mercaptopyruvate sulfurtransferase
MPAQAQMSHGVTVNAQWLEGHLDDANVVVLHADMRRSGYDEGHIPGARFLDMTRLVWDGDPAWGTEMTSPEQIEAALEDAGVRDGMHHIVVYAANPLFASRAFMTLEVMGLRGTVQMLDVGWGGWVDEGRATSTEEPSFAKGDLTLSPVQDILVDADWILERLDREDVALIDARPDDEYTGEDGGMGGMTKAGHIPGAVQMYWEELIDSRELPRMHERSRLAEMFEQAGAAEGDTVVAYCMVGWRASYNYMVARMLGYETKFYDGSWHDWGSRDGVPIAVGASPGGEF